MAKPIYYGNKNKNELKTCFQPVLQNLQESDEEKALSPASFQSASPRGVDNEVSHRTYLTYDQL